MSSWVQSLTLVIYYVRLDFINDFWEIQMQLDESFWSDSIDVANTFPRLFQMILEQLNNTKCHLAIAWHEPWHVKDMNGGDCDTQES